MTTQTTLPLDPDPAEPARATAGVAETDWRDRPPGWPGSPAWEAVARALDDDPDATPEELYQIAAGEDSRVRELTVRQHYARVPLQILRERGIRDRPPWIRERSEP